MRRHHSKAENALSLETKPARIERHNILLTNHPVYIILLLLLEQTKTSCLYGLFNNSFI